MIGTDHVDRNEEATYSEVENDYVYTVRTVRKANVMLGRRV
jgi:hypothetical protein